MSKHLSKLVGDYWRQALALLLIGLFVTMVLWYQLGTLVPGFSTPELAARANANSFRKILENPLFLPHKLMQYVLISLGRNGAFWMRTVSALWGLAVIVIFFDIIRNWYSRRVALLGGALFLSSAWFLHFARLGTPEIMYATTIGLLWVGVRLKSVNAPRIRTILASVLILGCSFYVPGLAWLIIPMLIWQRKVVASELSSIPRWLAALTILAVTVGVAPLIYSFVLNPVLIRDWLYIPSRINIGQFWSNLWHIPVWIALRGPVMPVYWLGRTPMFDVFSLVMAVLGLFVLNYYRLLDRVRAVIVIILLGFGLAVFNGWIALAVAMPLIFVVITAGIALFLQQWFTVFPRNPLARIAGITVVSFVVALACTYNLRSYFIAWPRTPATKLVFNKAP